MSEREPRADKVAIVDEVRERLASADAALLTDYRGIDVTDMQALRRSLTEAGGDYKIYKNTLVRLAVAGQGLDEFYELLLGPTAIAFVDGDAAPVAKVLRDFGRTNENLVIKGGLFGEAFIDADQIGALADLPPRDQLLAQFAAGLAAPMQKFAGLLNAVVSKFAYALQALIDAQGGIPEVAAEPEETESETDAPKAESGELPGEDEAPGGSGAEGAAGSEEPAELSDEPEDEPMADAEASAEAEDSAVAETTEAAGLPEDAPESAEREAPEASREEVAADAELPAEPEDQPNATAESEPESEDSAGAEKENP